MPSEPTTGVRVHDTEVTPKRFEVFGAAGHRQAGYRPCAQGIGGAFSTALFLAVAELYAVTPFPVTPRTREITGIRVALGWAGG